MTQPGGNDRLEALFLEALEQPERTRESWLLETCGHDVELLTHLRKLLQSDQKNQDGLLDAITADAFAEQVPTRIGIYNVSRLVGVGGMSAVFDSVHSGTGARTAVKVIRVGLATNRQRVRLQVESELLARLNHPGIAVLYDAGQADVRYSDGSSSRRMYIAMEFVDGLGINQFCETQDLSIHDRVLLMTSVSRAVQHAHESGVIHRDLKPANILVTPAGVTKVVDFGIARLVGSERHVTLTGVVMGTPSYMSPEQMAGKQDRVGTRSDVYSLGAVLYELLTGKPPIEAPSALSPSAAFSMLNAEPGRAITVNRDVPPDLDAIVHKALDRDLEKRYPTARELADDLDRWLKSLPVEARPPSLGDRLRLQVRRRPKLTAGLFVGALSLLTLGSFAGWQAVRATRASKHAIEQRDEAVKQSARADREARIATAVSAFFRDDILGQANSAAQANAGFDADPDIKISTALDRAAARLDKQLGDQPMVEAQIRYAMGQTYSGIGKFREAAEQFKKATEIKGGFEPKSAEMFDARTQYATAVADAGQNTEARDLLRAIHAEAAHALGEDHAITIIAMTNLTVQMAELAEHNDAIPLMQHNLELAIKTFGPNDTETLSIRGNLAFSLSLSGRLDEAVKMREEVTAIRKQIQGPNHPQTLLSMNNLAMAYKAQGNIKQAIDLTREILAVSRKTLGEDHPNTITMMGNLAAMLEQAGDYAEALKLAEDAYERRLRTMGPDHPLTLLSGDGLVDRLLEAGKPEESLALAKSSFERAIKALPPADTTTHSLGRAVVLALARLGRYEEALAEARRVAAMHVEHLGSDSPHTLLAQDLLVQELVSLKRFAEAEPIARDTFERAMRSDRFPKGNRNVVAARLARVLDKLNRPDDAEAIRATTRPTTQPTTGPG